MRKEIDMTTYPKRNQYHWFSTFMDPSYGFDVDIDVDKLVRVSHSRHESFFPYFLYVVMKGIQSVPELRMREVKGKVYLYDVINPTWTVMTQRGIYGNVGMVMENDFLTFYRNARQATDQLKSATLEDELDTSPICQEPNVVYATCLPTLEIVGMRHPTPANNHDSLSVPRILWDKFRLKEDGHYHLTLNITVSHTLVDGFPLAQAFNNIKDYAANFKL